MDEESDNPLTVQARFKSDTGEHTGNPLDLPANINRDQLQLICNALLEQVRYYYNWNNLNLSCKM